MAHGSYVMIYGGEAMSDLARVRADQAASARSAEAQHKSNGACEELFHRDHHLRATRWPPTITPTTGTAGSEKEVHGALRDVSRTPPVDSNVYIHVDRPIPSFEPSTTRSQDTRRTRQGGRLQEQDTGEDEPGSSSQQGHPK